MTFRFSTQIYYRAQTKIALYLVVGVLCIAFIHHYYEASLYLFVLLLPLIYLGIVSDNQLRDDNGGLVDSELTINDYDVIYVQPETRYRIEKPLVEIERSGLKSILGCPILTIYFQGNQMLRIVGLEDSEIAYEKLQARTKFRT